MHRFAPAAPDEPIVHGACRPGYDDADTSAGAVAAWIDAMQTNGIERVCCLLDEKRRRYDGLLDRYRTAFGPDNVQHAPIPDYEAVDVATLRDVILPFIRAADADGAPVVVHCSAGLGRTGHVLALWLASERGYDLDGAIDAVRETGRAPLEAVSRARLATLLAAVTE